MRSAIIEASNSMRSTKIYRIFNVDCEASHEVNRIASIKWSSEVGLQYIEVDYEITQASNVMRSIEV